MRTIINIYMKLFCDFFLLIRNLIKSQTKNTFLKSLKALIEWQFKLYITNLFMVVYFCNNTLMGKILFLLGCFFCSALGPGEEAIFRLGFVIVAVFVSANLILYFLVQTSFVQKLLLDSIGKKLFEEFIGF